MTDTTSVPNLNKKQALNFIKKKPVLAKIKIIEEIMEKENSLHKLHNWLLQNRVFIPGHLFRSWVGELSRELYLAFEGQAEFSAEMIRDYDLSGLIQQVKDDHPDHYYLKLMSYLANERNMDGNSVLKLFMNRYGYRCYRKDGFLRFVGASEG